MRHFGELTSEEIVEFVSRLEDAATKSVEGLDVGGLSQLNGHNVYEAIGDAVWREYGKALEWVHSKSKAPPRVLGALDVLDSVLELYDKGNALELCDRGDEPLQ